MTNVSAGASSGRRSFASCGPRRCRRPARRVRTLPSYDCARDLPRIAARSRRGRASAARQAAARASPVSRTEYQNAVRDLLGLEALPREIRVDFLLPADNISSGFDNIADLLFVSAEHSERYLDAARRSAASPSAIRRCRCWSTSTRSIEEHPQDERVDELPFGTRGGIAVRSEFPVDGTYIVRVDVGAAQGHDLEILVDGERLALRSLGGGRGDPAVDAPPGQPDPSDPDPRLPRSIDRQCREEARGRSTQRVRLAQQVHAGDAPVAGVEALHPFHSNSRSR